MPLMPDFWFVITLFGALIYSVASTIRDFRARRYVWAALGAVSAILLLGAPIKTHAIKLDLAPAHEIN